MNILSTIYRTFEVTDAHLVRGRLEVAGFDASVRHELSSLSIEGYTVASGGIEVQVPTEQAAEARAFLDHSVPTTE